MKPSATCRQRGFTLLETVIAIGVLAVLLTGFMVVFAPAADGIRKSINVQQADRMASALEQELVTLRKGEETANIKTGFDKSFYMIKNSTGAFVNNEDKGDPQNALLAYQYRAKLPFSARTKDDGTSAPEPSLSGKPGENYVVIPMMRLRSDSEFLNDLKAIEGGVYMVKCVQLVFQGGALQSIDTTDKSLRGMIKNPKPAPQNPTIPPYEPGPFTKPADYPEAVIAFSTEFYQTPAKASKYFENGGKFDDFYRKAKNPVFTRNLAVRR